MSASSRTAQLKTNIHTSTLSSALSISTFSLVLLVIRCSKAQCSFVQPGTGWMFFIRHTSKAIKRVVFFSKMFALHARKCPDDYYLRIQRSHYL